MKVSRTTCSSALPAKDVFPRNKRSRTLCLSGAQERLVYAPMTNLGGLLYDKDAVYIDIPDWKVQHTSQ
jgi:hypothetical protein